MHPEGCQGKTGNPYSTLELLTSQSERLLPIAVLSVAAFLRLYDLATIPGGLLTDEAFNGLDALRIIDGDRPIFLVENNGREPLFIYLQAISIAFLGQSALSLRVVSAILGIMTVVVSYFLAKRMFGNRVALLATGWLALSLWHRHFQSDRLAHNFVAADRRARNLLPLARARGGQDPSEGWERLSYPKSKIRPLVRSRWRNDRPVPLHLFNR